MLETARTRIRRFQASDLPNMIQLDSDPAVMRFTPSRFPLPAERSQQRLNDVIAKERERVPLGVWAAELKSTGEFVGWFMIMPGGREFPELGFMIVRKFWNQGLTTEIARGLLQHAREVSKHQTFLAVVSPDNLASISVLKKLGFQKIKDFREPDKVMNGEIDLQLFRLG